MALDFPSSPTNGATYAGYVYESARGVWLKQATSNIVQNDAPSSPFTGQFWYDLDDAILYVYDGTDWIEAGGGGGASVTASETAPEAPEAGNLWWDTNSGNLYIYYDDGDTQQWVAANGPQVVVSTSAPAGYQGQLWFDSNEGKTYIYYDDGTSGQWVSAIGGSLSGSVIQVVSTTKTDTFSASVAGGGLSAITGLSATITPTSASSKILVMVNTSGSASVGYGVTAIALDRGGTAIYVGDSAGTRVQISSGNFGAWGTDSNTIASVSAQYLDSPSTTSATTYSVKVFNPLSSTQTMYINRSSSDTDTYSRARAASTITLMEIAG